MNTFGITSRLVAAAALAGISMLPFSAPATAQTILRLDESPVGELDPAKASDYADTMLMVNLYDTLVLPAQGGVGVAPHLATDWEADGTVITFNLREDVTFQSGNPFTAEDVVYSFNRMMALGQGFSSLFENRVEAVEAVDTHTVRFSLTETFAPFIPALVRLPIIDSALARDHQKDGDFGEFGDYSQEFLASQSAGTGAYKVIDHNPVSETNMGKWDGYFLDVSESAPDQVRLRYGIEASTVRALMPRGEHDMTSQWLPPEVIRAISQEPGMQLLTEGGTTNFYIKMNTRKAPLDDVHCRLALTYAYDYSTSLQMLHINDELTQGVPTRGPIPSGLLGYDADAPIYEQDLERARAEFEQCEGAADTPIEIAWNSDVPAQERLALLMQANFQALGFQTTVTRLPWALYTERVATPENAPHISQVYVNATTPDTDSLLFNMYHSSAGGSWMSPEHLDDPHVDALLEAGRSETDEAARAEIYRELATYLREIAPSIFAYEFQAVFVARDVLSAPTFSVDAERFSLEGGFNFAFRLMEMSGN